MNINESTSDILKNIELKYDAIDLKTDTQLEGLLWSKPITYWDYMQTDALLNLQIQRTVLPDEMVFILYHQVNELTFKMILWEIDQIASTQDIQATFFAERLTRISRYFDMLTTSFNIMENGMEIDQYMKFRNTLTPASGFQSAQYRLIEFATTDLVNLVDYRYRKTIDAATSIEEVFEKLYWQAAGKDHKTGKKSYTLEAFEKKYKATFMTFMEEHKSCNIWRKFKELSDEDQKSTELVEAMRQLDYTINITWVMQHLRVAIKYIDQSGQGNGEATGGSDWRKYMHPQYQKRIFFPELWSDEELDNWGKEK
ncbi:tryptophan 2,3-dioxygenase family protein [Flavobacterium sp. NG2]|uniref:tryptophan 2,3-dioxygenase family protein n=1 Tax=Flavobacterium sp. NG2 TaxID=3097547 RepID=UPI002A81B189|nr:tryptophan 2,3-dioxygenase family protein [Flavobacterium sp. NG2]WPR72064.1 tryptophan 2,3-dioxygenase family protein [Flavobacterium sp. NG2]